MASRTYQAAFTAGLLDERLSGRKDVGIFWLGCRTLRNVIVNPQGEAGTRPGLAHFAYIDMAATGLPDDTPLAQAPFVFSSGETFLITFAAGNIFVHDATSGTQVARFAPPTSPYTAADIPNLRWQQIADTVVICDGARRMKKLVREVAGWSMSDWTWAGVDQQYQPFAKFVDPLITVKPSARTGAVTLTFSAPVTGNWNGRLLRIKGVAVKITSHSTSTSMTCAIIQEPDETSQLVDTKATTDWQEQAFSSVRGWPRCVVLHQNRLWVAGTPLMPTRVWSSVSDDFNKIWEDTGEDDQSINVATNAGTYDPIQFLISGRRGLEIYTTGGEFIIPSAEGEPITPKTVSIRAPTEYGCMNVLPAKLDGVTIFAQARGGSIRQFVYDWEQESMVATSLVVRVPELIEAPVAMASVSDAFGLKVDLLLVANDAGAIGALCWNRDQQVAAWAEWTTPGTILALTKVQSDIFVAIRRDGDGPSFRIERFTVGCRFDAEITATAVDPTDTWARPLPLKHQAIQAWADGRFIGDAPPGDIALPAEASTLTIGVPIDWRMKPMRVERSQGTLAGKPRRVAKTTVLVRDTAGLLIDGQPISAQPFDDAIEAAVPTVSGEYSVTGLGWSRDPAPELTRTGPFPVNVQALIFHVAAG